MVAFDVIVIGGGATGAGVARDAAMRKFTTLLVEQGDIGSGTSGRYHGLLHSGGRYAVTDPESAKECIEENLILKKIARHAIADTGGLFITTADDDLSYSEKFLTSCKQIGIPIDELSVTKTLEKEPLLNPGITRVFIIPDAVCDSQKLIRMNIKSAREYGATVLVNHAVVGFAIANKKIHAVHLVDMRTGIKTVIQCQFIINAAGAWAGNITKMAAIPLSLTAVKGSMVVMNGRLSHAVLNHCRPPSDGDILVSKEKTSVIGTTSVVIKNPDTNTVGDWEIKRLLEEGDALIKDFSKQSILYSYAGVRPLYNEHSSNIDSRKIKRTFTLINHKNNGAIDNMITIVGGKLTTYRAMAQATVTTMCQNLKTERICTTMQEPLPAVDSDHKRWKRFTTSFLKPANRKTTSLYKRN